MVKRGMALFLWAAVACVGWGGNSQAGFKISSTSNHGSKVFATPTLSSGGNTICGTTYPNRQRIQLTFLGGGCSSVRNCDSNTPYVYIETQLPTGPRDVINDSHCSGYHWAETASCICGFIN